MAYYQTELARIHHEAFGGYADSVAPGVVSRLRHKTSVVEVGCGSGSLTRHLIDAGLQVLATDASPAMVDLARIEVPEASPQVLTLPDDDIPPADAVVAAGTVFNYLESMSDIEAGIASAAKAGGVLVTDMLDLSYARARSWPVEFFHEGDGWKLDTVNRLMRPDLVVREMTIETEAGITHEVHNNLLVDVGSLAELVSGMGFEVTVSDSFGAESLPDGFTVLEVHNIE